MSRYAHLLDNFQLSDETRDLAADLIRQAKLRTGRGSGHELGEFDTGLPAVCALLASERLNTGEMSQKSAQAASCLNKKDFQRVYSTVRAVIEELEKEEGVKSTYAKLHEKYNTSGIVEEKLKPYFTEVENELMTLATGYDHRSAMFRCLVYFWVCGAAKLKGVPSTVSFAQEHRLPLKKFTDILYLLNMRKLELRKQMQAMFSKSGRASPSKQNVSTTQHHDNPRGRLKLVRQQWCSLNPLQKQSLRARELWRKGSLNHKHLVDHRGHWFCNKNLLQKIPRQRRRPGRPLLPQNHPTSPSSSPFPKQRATARITFQGQP
ncbi:hypothetical protein CPB84DRAFT_126919 [Gymnopilus junonius]|uniref:Uncharacterized protein n=1 Tax=Gymnopilus junonius TaxID=109634 RepID=A0A9P5TIS0_GYMJU|nr:hypothetical protein CPB84DRAFT_126919 [Gymnopilus junonius]